MTRRDWLVRALEGLILAGLSLALGYWVADALARIGG